MSTATSNSIGYCMKCRSQREIKDTRDITLKNGRAAMEGVCPECGTTIFKIIETA